MENIYGNVDYELKKYGHIMSDVSDRTAQPVNWNTSVSLKSQKIALAALSILLFLFMGVICAFSVFYYNKVISLQALNEQYANATARLATVTDDRDQLQVRYEKQVAELNGTEKLKSQLQVRYAKKVTELNETEKLKSQLQVRYAEKVAELNETEWLKSQLQVRYEKKVAELKACQNGGRCEEGWTRLGLKCYSFSNHKLNWERSRDACVEKGGYLVIITSQAEQKFLVSHAKESRWIGLNDLETEGKWMWVNNVPLSQTGAMFWEKRENTKSEPDNWKVEDPLGENCACMGTDGGNLQSWYDASCRKEKKFICQKTRSL